MTTLRPTRYQYVATAGQTVFTFNGAFFSTDEIVVWQTPSGQTAIDSNDLLSTTAYSVSSPGVTGGTVTLITPANEGDVITIERQMTLSSVATFSNTAPFTAEMLNASFDNVIYMCQGLTTALLLCPSYNQSATVVNGIDNVLPILAANQVWAMNSNRTAIVAVTIPTGIFTSGTVTSVATGAGLTGGPITVSGTISIAANGVTTGMIAGGSANTLGGWGNAGSYGPITLGAGITINGSGQLNVSGGGGGSGTVTSVATGTGLTGGTITTAGTISMAAGTNNTLAGYGGTGSFSGVTVGTGLTLTGGTLTASGGGSGSYVKISAQTASASASIIFTGLTSTYSEYHVVIRGAKPVASGQSFRLQYSTDGGSTWVSTADYGYGYLNISTSTANPTNGITSAYALLTGARLQDSTQGVLNSRISLIGAGVTGAIFSTESRSDFFSSDSSMIITAWQGGQTLGSTNINAIRFLYAAGNISTGTFTLYGITA